MRIGTRSTTDLTAALLLRTGDCRETMYLNGALYACYQQIQVLAKLREAMECLNAADMENLHRITGTEIPAILRYQLRCGHVSVYVEGIAMRHKCHVERFSEDDPTAVEREYGIAEIRAGKPLSRYELDNSKLRVSYLDGTVVVLEPRDPATGVLGGGIAGIQFLNLVEEHTMSFLFDGETGDVELCDGFYWADPRRDTRGARF